MYNAGSTVNLVNTTFSGNNSNVDGGAICNCTANSIVHLYNMTIANNQADADLSGTGAGGGIASYGAGAATDFANSIIALNYETALVSTAYQSTYGDCLGTITSGGYSILNAINPAACTVSGSIIQANPLLGPLGFNGGPTMTQTLLAGSPAINAGNPAGCMDNTGATLVVDQRGRARPTGLRCDIGAVEYAPYSLYFPFLSR